MGYETTTLIAENQNVRSVGYKMLGQLGLEHLADVQISAGNPTVERPCAGGFAEFMGDERHARVRDRIIEKAQMAQARGEDVEEAVLAPLELFIDRDDSGELVRVQDPTKKKLK